MKVLAVPVCFNEEKKIGRVLDRFVPGVADKVMVVDDGSTDGSQAVIAQRGVEILRHEQREGVGAAIRTVIHYARDQGFDILVIMAGNDKDRPDEIPRLVKPIAEGGYDFIQGSRYLPGGDFGNMPIYRSISTRWIHPLLFSLAVRRRITTAPMESALFACPCSTIPVSGSTSRGWMPMNWSPISCFRRSVWDTDSRKCPCPKFIRQKSSAIPK